MQLSEFSLYISAVSGKTGISVRYHGCNGGSGLTCLGGTALGVGVQNSEIRGASDDGGVTKACHLN